MDWTPLGGHFHAYFPCLTPRALASPHSPPPACTVPVKGVLYRGGEGGPLSMSRIHRLALFQLALSVLLGLAAIVRALIAYIRMK